MKRIGERQIPWLMLLASLGIAAAQPQQSDPPTRVARIGYMAGNVSFEPAGVDQWTGATLNYVMTTGDNLYTDTDSRAVVRIGRKSVRLAPGTNFQIVNLNDQVVQLSINSGALSVRVRDLYDGESWELDTPNGAITLLRNGEYRIDTDPTRNATMVTVRSGDVEVTSNDQSFGVHAQQTAYLAPDAAPDIQAMNPPDDFDSFASSRDHIEDVPPPQYVSPDLPGYEDLQANGTWQNTPDYGPVWMPRVDAGWAPYHAGHWGWVDPWGWTWIDDAPWGFAPFHYGRWAFINGGWGWCPGPVAARPVYAPALVAFVGGSGFGVGLSVGVGGGGLVGWFPLGPREPFYPTYHVSDAYVRNVNITNTNITNITNITNVTNVRNVTYVNQNVSGAVTAVPQRSFASAQSVQRAAVTITPQQIRTAQVTGTAPAVVPQRQSVLGSAGASRVAAPPANVVNRPVVARLAPPPAPVSFAAKQQMLQQHPGQPLAAQQLQTLRQQQPAAASTQRMQVRPVNAAQVRPITPPAPRPATTGGFNAPRPTPNPVNGARPQPAVPTSPVRPVPQPVTPANQPRPVTPQEQQPIRPVPNQPAPRAPQEQQPVRPVPNQPAPRAPQEQPVPLRQQQSTPPPARPVQPQATPAPARPVEPQATPAPARPVQPQAAPAPRPAQEQPRPAVQPQRQPPPPQRNVAPPPPPAKPAPKTKEEKAKEEKKE